MTQNANQGTMAESLYVRIGGAPAIKAVVKSFYDSVLDDKDLQHYFEGVNEDWLISSQISFFTQALGGPARYAGRDMVTAHSRLHITQEDFDVVAGYLVTTLSGMGVSEEMIGEVVEIVSPLAAAIVNEDEKVTEVEQSDEVKRLMSMIENAPVNIMCADKFGTIQYLNPKSRETLRRLESLLPVKVDAMVGCSFDIFHLNPDHQRSLVADDSRLPLQSNIQVGPETLNLLVSPMYGADGAYLGPMVTWEVITEKLKKDNDIARINSMMENAPVNIMCASKDGVIEYLNPKSKETLLGLEHLLPVRVADIVGASFDVFHKNPSYQRGLVKDDTALPILSEIQVGDESLNLLVSAMYGADGAYLGPMVTWEVITEKLKKDNEIARITSMMENAPVNIMCASKEGVIEYLNPKSRETLLSLEHLLPVQVKDIVGESFDVFHMDPSYQRGLVKDDTALPITSEITVGDENLNLLVSAMYGADGAYLGPMVTWEVITEKLKKDNDLARINSMMENAPVNIMCASKDGVIEYLNPKSRETLLSLEHLLPVKVADIVGGSFDVFHENPAYQRGLVKDDAALPITSEITVGDENLNLLVSAMYGVDGSYLGPMVTWEVITEKLKKDNEIARITSMMENAPVNIMCASKDGVIEYLNPKSKETLLGLEHLLPVKVNDIVGGSFDVFHENPSYQRGVVKDDAALPITSEIKVGDETLNLLVSAMYGADGSYIGPMVTWEVITEKLKKDNEIARVTSMMESAPINIMCADREGTIMYLNPKSTETLKSISHVLPIRPEEVLGASMDVFHENPSYQRKIIKDDSALPVQSNIEVGDETLDLLVSGVYGADGMYIGPMVTWEIVTQRLRQEAELADAQEREREASEELRDKVGRILEVVQAAETGDLTRTIDVIGDDAIGQMGEGLARFFGSLRQSIAGIAGNATTLASSAEELTATSEEMSSSSEETNAQANVVANSSRGVAESVQTVASGTEEMSSSIKEIAKNANRAAGIANEAVQVTEDTNTTISKLGESSAEIGQVIKVITSIAQQTNLLALNATIEAARAGDAGKGFAVVANEVKELAKETAKATEDISQKIQAIQGDTQESVSAIERISSIINQINDIQGAIASAVEQQTATTNEMARNVSDANQGAGDIAENISGVAKAAQETSQGAAAVESSALSLAKLAVELQTMVGGFKI